MGQMENPLPQSDKPNTGNGVQETPEETAEEKQDRIIDETFNINPPTSEELMSIINARNGIKPIGREFKNNTSESEGNKYTPEENELHMVHVRLDKPQFSPKDGSKISVDYVQKFDIEEWDFMKKNLTAQGFKIVELHNPRNK